MSLRSSAIPGDPLSQYGLIVYGWPDTYPYKLDPVDLEARDFNRVTITQKAYNRWEEED